MLHYETIARNTLELLKKLQSLEELKGMRLVGGTALALQLGHRKSVDLDFFGEVSASLEELTFEIAKFADVSPLSQSKLMRFLIVDGIKVDIVNYPYGWIDAPVSEDEITLAAITNRGAKKDFIDYYFLLKKFSIKELIGFYLEKFNDAQLFTAIKSLTYYDDAESDPMPDMKEPLDWEEVKQAITKAVGNYMQK